MRQSIRWAVRTVGLVSAAVQLHAQQPSADVSGRWSLAIRTPDGQESRTLDLVMAKNGTVTGSITAPMGTLDFSGGKLSGDSLHFEFAMAGGQIRVTYDGVVKSDSLRGVYRQEGYTGQFLGARGERDVRLPNDALGLETGYWDR